MWVFQQERIKYLYLPKYTSKNYREKEKMKVSTWTSAHLLLIV